ncbi:MAG: DnaJ domain-containing protein [Proteobacteria bacterium]|nr:DnaJ domain-containing protein [Pseudomonadota bacterium]
MGSLARTGSLADLPLPRLLLALHRERFQGALWLERQRVEKKSLWLAGAPVASESSLAGESLAALLVAQGVITQAQAGEIQAYAKKKRCSEGAAALGLRLLDSRALIQAMKEQTRRRLVDCFGWPDGDYRLAEDEPVPEETRAFRADPLPLVQAGLETHWSPNRLLEELVGRSAEYPQPSGDPGKLRERLLRDETVERLLASLNGDRSLGELLSLAATSPRAVAAAWLLEAGGLVEFAGRPASADDEPAAPVAPEFVIEVADATSAPTAEPAAAEAPSVTTPQETAPAGESELRQEILERHTALSDLDHYALLGVERDAATAPIKKAYFHAAKRYHPDALSRSGLDDIRDEAREVFSRIAEAYAVLTDEDKRRNYDVQLDAGAEGDIDVERLAQAEMQFRKGEVLVRMGNFKGAIEFLDSAVQLWPDEAAYQATLGWALFRKAPKEPELAREHLERAVELDKTDAVTYARLAMVLRDLGDEDGAARAQAIAKKLDPKATA